LRRNSGGQLDRQATLPAAAGPGEGQQPRRREEPPGVGELPLAANEARDLSGEITWGLLRRPGLVSRLTDPSRRTVRCGISRGGRWQDRVGRRESSGQDRAAELLTGGFRLGVQLAGEGLAELFVLAQRQAPSAGPGVYPHELDVRLLVGRVAQE